MQKQENLGPIIDARNFQQEEVLKNGITVKIRAVRPGDKSGIADAFGKLDPESVRTRFFSAKDSLSDKELEAAAEIDFENVVALVVTVESGGRETIIGGGRYVVFNSAGGRSAEIAFVVEEDYSGLGIAGRILKHLTRIAREKGVGRFEAEVLQQNKAMLAVFRRSGLPMQLTPEEGSFHVILSLTVPLDSGRGCCGTPPE
jgi:RimJ/RimL family protein N-acetyltransferase